MQLPAGEILLRRLCGTVQSRKPCLALAVRHMWSSTLPRRRGRPIRGRCPRWVNKMGPVSGRSSRRLFSSDRRTCMEHVTMQAFPWFLAPT